ncbi:MAG: hypothetical protein HY043_10390 [Verrucomicrobia bacterium]|nr:hypothetical protein [Verrucomicrobiota bacterium]
MTAKLRAHWVLSAFAAALALPLSVAAQTVDAEYVQKLLKRVEQLESEVKELKGGAASASSAANAFEAVKDAFPRVSFHGFGDVDYRINNRVGEKNSFVLGQLDFFITSKLSDTVSILNETVVEANEHNNFGIEVERLLLQYHPSDYFHIDFGRYHTGVGYYNTAYHHGTWFQTATGRPSFLDFEDGGGLIPAHNVGFTASGDIPSGKLGLRYTVEVGNGRPFHKPDTGNNPVLSISDDNEYKAVNVAFTARPECLPGLQLGVGLYHDTLTPEDTPRTDEEMFHAHVVYKQGNWELLNEGYLVRHKTRGDQAHWTPAFFNQVAYKFGKFTPYARFSYIHAPLVDQVWTVIGANGLRYGPGVGLRYDFTNLAAFKVQYDHQIETGQRDANELTLQAAFTF